MPFSRVFERNVNRNMQEDTDSHDQSESSEEANIKKHLEATSPTSEEDYEMSTKKDRPPRFSTLFEAKPAPQIIERYITEPPKKRRGVYIPLPLFILLAIILFFESTLLFAYTIIALDNNLPTGLFPIGSPTRLDECNCSQQPAINVAPKFFMGSAQVASDAPLLPDATTSSSTSSTSTTKPTAQGTAHVTKVVTVTPTAVAVSSVINLTVDPNGSTVTPTKTTPFTTIPAPSGKGKKRASLQSKLESIASENGSVGGKDAPTPTTLVTAKAAEDPATTSSAAGGGL